jgi:hypothetical protein
VTASIDNAVEVRTESERPLDEKINYVLTWKILTESYQTIAKFERGENIQIQEGIYKAKTSLNICIAKLQRNMPMIADQFSSNRIFDNWFRTFCTFMDNSWRFVDGCWRPFIDESEHSYFEEFQGKLIEVFRCEEQDNGIVTITNQLSQEKLHCWYEKNEL